MEFLEPRIVLSTGPLRISEFLAENNNGLRDDYGNNSDWIEIYNPTSTPINLTNWYLTDTASDLTKWKFPSGSVDAGGYFVVFASNSDGIGPSGKLHTNFNLKKAGEYLALVQPDGVTRSDEYSPTYPTQYEDVSYGLAQDVTTLVTAGSSGAYHVPISSDSGLGTAWTATNYDDSAWVHDTLPDSSGLVVTEVCTSGTHYVEIQNATSQAIDTTGWSVLVNNPTSGINGVNSTAWSLPAAPNRVAAGAVLYRTDNTSDQYWGSAINWTAGGNGWAMIVDNVGKPRDFAAWGYTTSQVASLDVSFGSFTHIKATQQWSGAGVTTSAGAAGFVAYNDHVPGTGTSANATSYATYSGATASGLMKNVVTGASTTATLAMAASGTSVGIESPTDPVTLPAGSDAYNSFNGYVDFTSGTNTSIGLTGTGAYTQTFSGLTSANTSYSYVGTALRGGSSYTDRWTLITLVGTDSATLASTASAGVVVISPTQVAVWTGYNTGAGQGYVAKWTNIDPGTDGQFSVVSTDYTGATPSGITAGTKAYGVTGLRLEASTSYVLQRRGTSDHNTLADFSWVATGNKGTQNPSLTTPFPSTSSHVVVGIGFDKNPGSLNVTFYQSNLTALSSLSTAEQVIRSPSMQTSTATETAPYVNYLGNGGAGHFGSDRAFPSLTVGSTAQYYVIQATGYVIIPTAGPWTFGVNSDDGFGLTLTNGTDTFTSSYSGVRGAGDTLSTFSITTPGAYQVRLVGFQNTGGSEIELFAAKGSFAAFDSGAFHLVGDTSSGGLQLEPFGDTIRSDCSAMQTVNASVQLRVPFQVTSTAGIESLALRMKYNDGFVAYLNGHEIARSNAPAGTPSWNAIATSARSLADSITPQEFNITPYLSYLVAGTNVLAIQGLNSSAADGNLLVAPELYAVMTQSLDRYFATPTPGSANLSGTLDIVNDTKFSVDRGFFDQPFSLAITTATPDATIRYTVDGSTPSETAGTVYTGPITISKTTVVRAIAYKAGYMSADVDTQTYLFIADVLTQSPNEKTPPPDRTLQSWSFNTTSEGFTYADDAFNSTANPNLENGDYSTAGGYLSSGRLHVALAGTITSGLSGAWSRTVTLAAADTVDVSVRYRLAMGAGSTSTSYGEMLMKVDGALYGAGTNTSLVHRSGAGSYDSGWLTACFRIPMNAGDHTITIGAYSNQAPSSTATTDAYIEDISLTHSLWPIGSVNGQVLDYGMDPEIVNNATWGPQMTAALTQIPTISIVTDLSNLFDASTGIYTHANEDGADWEKAASVELINPNGSQGFQIGAGLRIRGGYSRDGSNPKHAFRLLFNNTNGDGSLKFPLFGDDGVSTFDNIDLRCAENYSWSFEGSTYNTMIRDDFARDTQGATGDLHTRSKAYNLYIDGQYWGVYETEERPEASYAASYLGGDPSDYDVIKVDKDSGYSIYATDGTFAAWQQLWSMAQAGFATDAAYYHAQGLDPVTKQRDPNYPVLLDANNLADYMLIQLYTGDMDAPISNFLSNLSPNNWYGVRNRNGEQGFMFFCHDAEHTLTRADAIAGGSANRNGPFSAGQGNVLKSSPQYLHEELMANPEYRMLFADRAQKFLLNNGILTAAAAQTRYQARANSISLAIIAESARWGDSKATTPRTKTDWQSSVNADLTSFLAGRSQILLNQLKSTVLPSWRGGGSAPLYPSLAPAEFYNSAGAILHGGQVDAGYAMSLRAATGTIYYSLDGTDPRLPGGAINSSPSVKIYSSSIILTKSTLVRTRVYSGGTWSALNEAQFYVGEAATAGNLAISEINYNPYDPTPAELATNPTFDHDSFEFIELYNTTNAKLDLTGVRFTNGISFEFSSGSVKELGPYQSVLVVANLAAFQARYGVGMNIAGQYTGTLSNNGERLTLFDRRGLAICDFSYKDSGKWPSRADGDGSTLVIVNPTGDQSDGQNWAPSTAYGGTPGQTGLGPATDVLVNEVLSWPTGSAKAAIELYNTADQPVNVGGWYLSDTKSDYKKFRIPANTVLAAHGYLVYEETAFNPTHGTGPNDIVLSGTTGNDVWLLQANADGNLKRFADHVEIGAALAGVSYGRSPNGSGELTLMNNVTLGSANSQPKNGDIVINELHVNPDIKTELVEFVELYNNGAGSVDLSNWTFSNGIDFTFPAGTILAAGAYLVVSQNPTAVQNKFHIASLGSYSKSLGNDGDDIVLRDSYGTKQDEVDYGQGFPWPTIGDSAGYSMELINPNLDNNLGGSWRRSSPEGTSTSTTLVAAGATWKYFKGTTAPVATWQQRVSDETGWTSAAAPIGYGQAFVRSTLSDMSGNYSTYYLRTSFTVSDPAKINTLQLRAQYDDGFNVWINGTQVLSVNSPSGNPAYNALAVVPAGDIEYETFALTYPVNYLVAGSNTIAIQVLNCTKSSDDAFFDAQLLGWATAAHPTPGAANAAFATNAPPQMRQVDNTPQQPLANQAVTITVKVTDPDGVQNVALQYQLVDPGDYIGLSDPRYQTQWTTAAMADNGANGDQYAGDNIYTYVMPASVQTNRRLVRYRITATDTLGASIRAPYADDMQPNFAYFVYNGVPSYSAAIQPGSTDPTKALVTQVPASVMNSVAVYQLLSTNASVQQSNWTQQYWGDLYKWEGTLIYNGVVYDHIRYRARGGVWRYAMGKDMWEFDMNSGHEFQGYDNYGNAYPVKWDKVNLGACIQQGDYGFRGEQGMFESVDARLLELAGVPSAQTSFTELRVIDAAAETGATQYDGDFWGLYLSVEEVDGNLLDQFDLADGNLYKMDTGDVNVGPGGGMKKNQGDSQPTDNSDLVTFTSTYGNTTSPPSIQWWRDNFDLSTYYSYRSIVESVHHYDIGYGKNYFYYDDPDTGQWSVIPWDMDLTWANSMFGDGNEPFKSKVLSQLIFAQEYRNRMREVRDLLYNSDQTGQLIDETAHFIFNSAPGAVSLVDADRDMWDYNPIMVSSYVNSSKAGQGRFYAGSSSLGITIPSPGGFAGMLQWMKNYVVSRGSWIDSSILTDDAQVPGKATVSYIGAAGYPIDGLRFQTTTYSSPTSTPFAAMEWRIARVTNPSDTNFDPSQPRYYEINSEWDSGELPSFANTISIPGSELVVGGTYRVRVRMKDNLGRWGHWSNATQLVVGGSTGAVPDALRISEINYNPVAPASGSYTAGDFQFIELTNTGAQALALGGTQFTQGISFTFPTMSLAAGQQVVVVANQAAFQSRYPTGINIAGTFTGSLDNAGERIVLTAYNRTVQDFTYGSDGAWPSRANGKGSTLEVVDMTSSYSTPSNWRASNKYNGSPGTLDSDPANDNVVINEVLAHTDLPQYDTIEFYNTTGNTVDIGGWYLSDSVGDLKKFQIPSGTGSILASGQYAVFDDRDFGIAPYAGSGGGSTAVSDGGATLSITGAAWRRISLPYTVTSDTYLEFDFQSTSQGRIQGIGLDDDDAKSANRTFRLYGSQSWGISNYATYNPANGWTHYVIPVGAYYTGNMTCLFFANDDTANGTAQSAFRNVTIRTAAATKTIDFSRYFRLDSAHGDDVWLMSTDAASNLNRFIDHFQFLGAAHGESFGRWPNGTGNLYPLQNQTLGQANDSGGNGPRVGPILISEVSYDPGPGADDDLEYIEVFNPTSTAIASLAHWRLTGGITYNFPAAQGLAPGQALLVVSFDPTDSANADKLAALRNHYSIAASVAIVGGYSGHLNDAGDTIQLQRPDAPPAGEPDFYPSLLEDEVIYSAMWGASETGETLRRLGVGLWGDSPASWAASTPSPGTFYVTPALVSEHVFYNQSAYDSNNAAAETADDHAIATDKTALLPGQKATLANYTSYVRGLNGIMVDIAALANPSSLSTADFQFREGNSSTPGSWIAAPAPLSVTVRTGAGTSGSDRVTLIWADGAILDAWLQVTVLDTANTGLSASSTFYYGNAVGESGNHSTGNSPDAVVDSADEAAIRAARSGFGTVTDSSMFDFNRDGRIGVDDELIVRWNDSTTAPLLLIDLGAGTPNGSIPTPPTPPANQALTVDPGTHYMLPDTQRQFAILISGDAQVAGMTLCLQIGDGGPENGGENLGPRITAVDVLGSGTVFHASNTGSTGQQEGSLMWLVETTTAGGQVPATGTLALVTIDTTGVEPGRTFAFRVKGVDARDFVGGLSSSFGNATATLLDGQIIVTSPHSMTSGGPASGDWTDPSQWSGGPPAIPDYTANAIITSPHTVDVNSSQEANSLFVSNGGLLNIDAGGTLRAGNSATISGGTLQVAADGTMVVAGTLNVETGGKVAGSIQAAAFSLSDGIVSADLSGAGGLTKVSPGTVVLSGVNHYLGDTIVVSGTLIATSDTALPTGGSLTVGSDGGLAFGGGLSTAAAALGVAVNSVGHEGGADTDPPVKMDSVVSSDVAIVDAVLAASSPPFSLSGPARPSVFSPQAASWKARQFSSTTVRNAVATTSVARVPILNLELVQAALNYESKRRSSRAASALAKAIDLVLASSE
jgi:autotransporter-associated beta strand protein